LCMSIPMNNLGVEVVTFLDMSDIF